MLVLNECLLNWIQLNWIGARISNSKTENVAISLSPVWSLPIFLKSSDDWAQHELPPLSHLSKPKMLSHFMPCWFFPFLQRIRWDMVYLQRLYQSSFWRCNWIFPLQKSVIDFHLERQRLTTGCFGQSQYSVFKYDQPSEPKIYPIRANPHHLLDGLFHVTSKKHRSIRLFKSNQISMLFKLTIVIFILVGKTPKNNVQPARQLCSFLMLVRLYSKSFKLVFSSTWTKNFQMHKLHLAEAEKQWIKLPTVAGS